METVNTPSLYDNTVDMLQMLDDNELQAIQSVVKMLIAAPKTSRPYQPLTEDQLFERIDTALKHAEEGIYEDAEDAENEIRAELGL